MLRKLRALSCTIWYAIPVLILAGCFFPVPLLLPSSPSPAPLNYTSAPPAPKSCGQPILPPAELLSNPGYRQFEAYALDGSGAPATGLGQADFAVKDGSTAVPISYFRHNPSDTPASVVIVIDASESMASKINPRSSDTAAKVHSALAKSIEGFGRCEEIGIVVSGGKYASGFRPKDFGLPAALSDVTVLTPFTSDRSVALTALDNIVASGRGDLADAIEQGIRQFSGAPHPARVMVVVTDGLDNRALDARQRFFQIAKLYGLTIKVVGIGHEHKLAQIH